mgnify:FL=1|jgi:hypothetical protein
MKITRRQLRKIITEATKLMEYGESGSWGAPMNDYEQGYNDGHGGFHHQGSSLEYDEGYKAGKRESGVASLQRDQDRYDDQIMDVGYYYD